MNDEMSDPADRVKLEEEISKISSQVVALAERKQLYLKRLSAAKGTKSIDAQHPSLSDDEKLSLFLSRFQGRTDVYAKRWENRVGRSGYSPVCKNEWDRLLCRKPEKKCADCDNRDYLPFDSGEGFDEPRLDTLFLTMPASFKGKIVQYTGRLHRRHSNKTEVRVYDYLDSKVSVLANMHKKRLKTYKMLGYTVTTGDDQLLPGL